LEYAKDAVWGKWVRWILLIVSSIIFPLILGYLLEILRGKKPAPELADWGKLFVDGIKLFVIGLIYAIPAVVVGGIFIGAAFVPYLSAGVTGAHTGLIANRGFLATGFILTALVAFIVGLIEVAGIVRFARMGRMGEAFNFGAIFSRIGKIGWVSYIVVLIVLTIVVGIIWYILRHIPFVGQLILLIITPILVIFVARAIALVYDSVPAEAPPATPPAA
jgi:hypothetical protein